MTEATMPADVVKMLEDLIEQQARDLDAHDKARTCVVCNGYICPPMTCTGCQLYHGEATAITDHALRVECDKLRTDLDAARAEVAVLRLNVDEARQQRDVALAVEAELRGKLEAAERERETWQDKCAAYREDIQRESDHRRQEREELGAQVDRLTGELATLRQRALPAEAVEAWRAWQALTPGGRNAIVTGLRKVPYAHPSECSAAIDLLAALAPAPAAEEPQKPAGEVGRCCCADGGPGSYEGPMRACPVHGEEERLDDTDGCAGIDDEEAKVRAELTAARADEHIERIAKEQTMTEETKTEPQRPGLNDYEARLKEACETLNAVRPVVEAAQRLDRSGLDEAIAALPAAIQWHP